MKLPITNYMSLCDGDHRIVRRFDDELHRARGRQQHYGDIFQ